MKTPAHLLLCALLMLGTGCSTFWGRGGIKAGDVSVHGVKDAGKAATLNTSQAGEHVALPAGSTVTVTKEAPTDAKPATKDAPAVTAQPAKETTVITPGGPTEWTRTESTVKADTGTVDTSVRTHEIDVAERRWLLWAAIGCGIAGLVVRSMLPAWPALSNGLLAAAVLAFASWKLADIPSWIWLVVLGIAGALAAGYKRAEWDRNGDGIPDILQKNTGQETPKEP